MSIDFIRAELDRWPEGPQKSVCWKIMDYLEFTPPEQRKRMTFGHLADIANNGEFNNDLTSATCILSASSFAALDVRAVVIDEDGSEHDLDPSCLLQAMNGNSVDHPVTGEPTTLDRVLPYFVPSALAMRP